MCQVFIDAVKRGCEGLTAVSTGLCPGCDQCRSDYGIEAGESEAFDLAIQNGSVPNEPYFSWRPCVICGSSFGGDREPAHAIDANGELVHLGGACVDCMLYLANGDLPNRYDFGWEPGR
jgi:hypothetical protein